MTEEECVGILVFDKPYKGVEVLDRSFPNLPGPLLEGDALTRIRAEEAKAWEKFLSKAKPVRSPSLPRSLSILRDRKRCEPKNFARPASAKAVRAADEALPVRIPTAWQKVLSTANGGQIQNSHLASGHACRIKAIEELLKFQGEQQRCIQYIQPGFPVHLLPVGESEVGDFICLDTASTNPDGDCRVLLISHETGEPEREWSSVAEFLEELLTSEED